MTGEYAKCEFKCKWDDDCPLFHFCCLNECGRVCVPAQADVVDDCGCSVTFLKSKDYYNNNRYLETFNNYIYQKDDEHFRVLNLVWETLSESFTPALEPYIVEGLYETAYFGAMGSQCSFKRAIEFGPKPTRYNAFKKPRRILFIIFDDAKLFEEIAAAPLNNFYTTVCAVSVGNFSSNGSLLQQLSVIDNDQPCLWSVESYKSLGDVAPNISSIVNDGSCLCGAETTPSFPCKGEGETCNIDSDCDQPSLICHKGTCSSVICTQPETYDPEAFYVDDYSAYDYLYDYPYDGAESNYEDDYFGFYDDYDYFFRNDASRTPMSVGSRKMKKGSKKLARDTTVAAHAPTETPGNRGNRQKTNKYKVDVPTRLTQLSDNILACCSWKEFRCSGVPAICIQASGICDGVSDCFHGDDETAEACAKRICDDKWFKCTSGQCINETQRCDGIKNCPDGSDENCLNQSDCPSTRPHYCSSGECIGFRQICDQVQDCKSGEDEIHCRCKGHKCSSLVCIQENKVCDGNNDCPDGSDEHCINGSCPTNRPFKCGDGKCIEERYVCDMLYNCADGSDQALASCSPESCLYCDSGQCIRNTTMCDGFDDCADRSDETNCKNFQCGTNMFHCNSGECLPSSVTCNGREECVDGSDELICDTCPDSRPLRCSSGICIAYSMVCDGIYHCTDKSDESKCMDMTCPVTRPNKCDSGQCIPDYGYCLDGSDAISKPVSKCDRFICESGKCAYRCNGQRECEDGSDEEDCEDVPCPSTTDWRCKSGECMWNYYRCDGRKQCNDGSDEVDCLDYKCSSDEIQCSSGQCILDSDKCNGLFDCKDGSDEKDCIKTPKCLKSEKKCKSGECINEYQVCDGYRQCFDGSDEDYCQNYTCPADGSFRCKSGVCIKTSRRCDGFISCADGSDEEDCMSFSCPSYRPFSCPSGVCITYYQLCNGVDDCGDGSDELDCGNVTCPKNAFKCNKGNCIPPRYRCDGEDDCQDGEDELNCENYEIQCEYRIPCIADKKCVDFIYHCSSG